MPVAAGIGRKLNSTIAILRSARALRRSATSRATRAASIAARSGMRRHVAPPVAAPPLERPPKVIGQIAPSSSGIATIIVASTGVSPRAIVLPLLQRLEFDRMRRDIGHIERRQQFLGGAGIVVGGAADQREAGQRNHRIDRGRAVAA